MTNPVGMHYASLSILQKKTIYRGMPILYTIIPPLPFFSLEDAHSGLPLKCPFPFWTNRSAQQVADVLKMDFETYFGIFKTVMAFLVNKTKNMAQKELVGALYNDSVDLR